ncbi:MAG: DNA translocase FtsK [Thermacetogeniaceae bacterium]|jgi:S-DNA-T family DNA segregation ATPase FtsK/SpoIIIE
MPAKVSKVKRIKQPTGDRMTHEIVGIVLLALAVLMLVGVHAQTGIVGSLIAYVLRHLAGDQGKFGVILATAYFGVCLCIYRRPLSKIPRTAGVLVSLVVVLTICHFLLAPANIARNGMISLFWSAGLGGEGGGILGAILSMVSVYFFARIGTMIVLFCLAGIAIILLTGIPLSRLLSGAGSCLASGWRSLKHNLVNFMYVEDDPEAGGENTRDVKLAGRDEIPGQSLPVIIDYGATNSSPKEDGKMPLAPGVSQDQRHDAVKIAPGNDADKNLPGNYENYKLPSLSLLSRSLKVKSSRINKEILENVRILEETLESFGVKVCVSQVHRGPAITRYEIQPGPGVKVSKIVRLADDIALSLAAQDVRIEAPIPGKSALGIEVPNKDVSTVYLREILECPEFMDAASKISIALGKDIAGNPIVADLMKMPHLLIAGATGSGKSVCLNSIITSILYKATPNEVKFVMIDPKMVELIGYNGIPHLLSPVVTDPRKAATALKWVVSEMETRYELFSSMGIRDIIRYNSQSENHRQCEPLPYIVVVIDELADLMMIAPIEVEDIICRLSQMARAAGIHLVVATQRPSVDVITGLIKANIPARIAFAVSSQIDSRTILDMGGAEKLLGKGDMLFVPVGASKPIRIQGALVTDTEVEDIVGYILKQGKPLYIAGFLEQSETEFKVEKFEDPLFQDAAKLVLDQGHASVSMLQRRFRIGYARAGRLMDILEEKGIVGPYGGAKPRDVLMTSEQFRRYYGKSI